MKKTDVFDFEKKEHIENRQVTALRTILKTAQDKSRYYRKLFRKISISYRDLRSLDDLKKFPITTKDDLRNNNWEFCAAEQSKWCDVFFTSGTIGDPIFIPYTYNDLMIRLSNTAANPMLAAGIKKNDKVQLTLPLGTRMWQAGLAYWLGNMQNRSCSLRFGPTPLEYQVENMQLLKPSVILGSPSFLIKLGTLAREKEIFKKFRPRVILTIGENILNENLQMNVLGTHLEKVWGGTQIRSGYGNTEGGFGAFECAFHRGHHLASQFTIIEVIDPKTSLAVPEGKLGNLVVTTLQTEGLPLIRYATGDITFALKGSCPCGRNSPRIGPIIGRIDQQIKIKGVKIYPQFIENILLEIPAIDLYYIESFKDKHLAEQLRIRVSLKNTGQPKQALKVINNHLCSKLGFSVELSLEPREKILAKIMSKGTKPTRFFDLKNIPV